MIIAWRKKRNKEAVFQKEVHISVIIPFRNEAPNLVVLLQSIKEQHPFNGTVEYILVDDHSEDDFNSLVGEFGGEIKWIKNSGKGKKMAIDTGINYASGGLIVTTDADCILPNTWMKSISNHYSYKRDKLIIAPVFVSSTNSFIKEMLSLEFSSLQAISGGMALVKTPIMCNGANLIFEKQVYEEVNGYSGNMHVASGDDSFLLEKVKEKYPDDIGYLNSRGGVVKTSLPKTINEFIFQRIRWAQKTKEISDEHTKVYGILILLMNLFSFLGIIMALLVESFWPLLPFVIKIAADTVLFRTIPQWIKTDSWWIVLLPASLLYPIYTLVISMLSLFMKPRWKGRIV